MAYRSFILYMVKVSIETMYMILVGFISVRLEIQITKLLH